MTFQSIHFPSGYFSLSLLTCTISSPLPQLYFSLIPPPYLVSITNVIIIPSYWIFVTLLLSYLYLYYDILICSCLIIITISDNFFLLQTTISSCELTLFLFKECNQMIKFEEHIVYEILFRWLNVLYLMIFIHIEAYKRKTP